MIDEKNDQVNVTTTTTQNKVEKKKTSPIFFVDKQQISIDIYVIFDNLTGRIINVSSENLSSQLSEIQGIDSAVYTFIFTKPNYQQISRYRQLAMYWDNRANKTIVNPFKLRNYLILNHLKAWKGVKDQYGSDVQLAIDNDDTLTQQSLETVYKVNSAIIDVLMTQYESRAMLF